MNYLKEIEDLNEESSLDKLEGVSGRFILTALLNAIIADDEKAFKVIMMDNAYKNIDLSQRIVNQDIQFNEEAVYVDGRSHYLMADRGSYSESINIFEAAIAHQNELYFKVLIEKLSYDDNLSSIGAYDALSKPLSSFTGLLKAVSINTNKAVRNDLFAMGFLNIFREKKDFNYCHQKEDGDFLKILRLYEKFIEKDECKEVISNYIIENINKIDTIFFTQSTNRLPSNDVRLVMQESFINMVKNLSDTARVSILEKAFKINDFMYFMRHERTGNNNLESLFSDAKKHQLDKGLNGKIMDALIKDNKELLIKANGDDILKTILLVRATVKAKDNMEVENLKNDCLISIERAALKVNVRKSKP